MKLNFLKRRDSLVLLSLITLMLVFSVSARLALYSNVETQVFDFESLDGTKIHSVIYKPVKSQGKLPAVITIHGFSASHDALNAINTELARHGILVMSIDYRGHGDSEGGVNYIGDPITAPNISNDIFVAYNKLITRDDVDASRIAIIGHSMGSRAALVFSISIPVTATILLGPYYIWEASSVNQTTPKNLLILVGKDDLITSPDLAWELFARATGYMGVAGELFGDFSTGTARKLLVLEGADHYTILIDNRALREILLWLYNSGFGPPSEPKVQVDPSIMGVGVFITYLCLIGIFPVIYASSMYLSNRFKSGRGVSIGYNIFFKVFIIAIAMIIYILIGYFTLPLVVELGWQNYKQFMMSGAQYTINYFYYLTLPLAITFIAIAIVLIVLRKMGPTNIIEKAKGGLALGGILALITFAWVFFGYNVALTGISADYMPTIRRFGALIFLLVILLPLLLIDELFFRYIIQENIPIGKKPIRLLVIIILQYLARVVPFVIWVGLAMNRAVLIDVLYDYYTANLIKDINIVAAFLPMNAYSLYYSFGSIELFQASSASYIYEESKSVIATTLTRALMMAFTMAAVLPFL